jgi:hypothetical protein
MRFQSVIPIALLAFGISSTGRAQSLEASPGSKWGSKWNDPYRWSVAAVSVATAADMASSFKFSSDGQKEANPFLKSPNGLYGAKGAAIEAGMVGGSLILQHYLVRKHPRLRVPLMVGNYALAGFQAFNVAHNVRY